jgi:phage terminase small subunit
MQATLTDRQERFVLEYLKDLNASAAAARAGYAARSRASRASELMRDPLVRERIRLELRNLLADLKVSVLDLMKERMKAAFFRAHKLFGPGGRVLEFEEMDADTRDALIVNIEMRRGEPVVRMRQPNREQALRALERVHERLEKLSEDYYERLEWEAGVEAEGEDGAEADEARAAKVAGDEARFAQTDWEQMQAARNARFAEEPKVLSGSGGGDGAGTPARPGVFPEKPQVFSGSGAHRAASPADFSAKTQVLSGSGVSTGEPMGLATALMLRAQAAARQFVGGRPGT